MDITTALRRGLPALALVAAGLTLTACGPDHTTGSASPSGSGSATASSTGTPAPGGTGAASGSASATAAPGSDGGANGGSTGGGSSTGSSSSTGGGSSTGGNGGSSGGGSAGGVPTCASDHLKVSTAGLEAGAGSLTFQVVFTNTGSRTCALVGYPGVSFIDSHGRQLGNAAVRLPARSAVVTLIPNAHAIADARTSDGLGGFPAGTCDLKTAASLRVYPPNRKESLTTPWNKKVCAGSGVHALKISPVHPVS